MKKLICLTLATCLIFAQTFAVNATSSDRLYRYFFDQESNNPMQVIPDINGYDECVIGMLHYKVTDNNGQVTSNTTDKYLYTPKQNGQLTVSVNFENCFPKEEISYGIGLSIYNANGKLLGFSYSFDKIKTLSINVTEGEAIIVKCNYLSDRKGYLLDPYKLYFEYK